MEKLNGIIAVNKPSGIVSHDIVDYMRKILVFFKKETPWINGNIDKSKYPSAEKELIPINSENHPSKSQSNNSNRKRKFEKWPAEAKVGHGGTLDPLASGILIIGIGKGTKLLQYFLKNTRKVYLAHGKFGFSTDTYDSTGSLINTSSTDHITKEAVQQILSGKLTGEIYQKPPIFSALKINGKRMCDIARSAASKNDPDKLKQLINVDKTRKTSVYDIQLVDWNDHDGEFQVKIECSSGTYVRSIIHELGEYLQSSAHMTQLIRIRQGPFNLMSTDIGCIPALEVNQLCDYTELCHYLQNSRYQETIDNDLIAVTTNDKNMDRVRKINDKHELDEVSIKKSRKQEE